MRIVLSCGQRGNKGILCPDRGKYHHLTTPSKIGASVEKNTCPSSQLNSESEENTYWIIICHSCQPDPIALDCRKEIKGPE
jgi:hypothetical protein